MSLVQPRQRRLNVETLLEQALVDINPIVDASATPIGYRDVTGTQWSISDRAIRGGIQPSSPVWGNSRIVWLGDTNTPIRWQPGKVVAALITLSDFSDRFAFGLSLSRTPGNPASDYGYSWFIDAGNLQTIGPRGATVISNTQTNIRTNTYLAFFVMLKTGAAFFLQAVSDDTGGNMLGPVPINGVASGQARLVGYQEHGPLGYVYPYVSALGTGNPYIYPGGHMVQQVWIGDVAAWRAEDALASFADRFNRANTPSTIGNGWAAIGCTAGVIDGQAYISAGSGFQFVMHANALANARLEFDLNFPQYPTIPLVGVVTHGDSVANFQNGVRIHTNGGNSLFVQAVQNRGFQDTIFSTGVTWQPRNRVGVFQYGNQYLLEVNGTILNGGNWIVDSNSYYVNQTHIGLYSQADPNTARWDNVQVLPHSIAVPTIIQQTSGATTFTPSSTRLLNGFGGGSAVTGTWTNNAGTMTQDVASGEAFYRIPLAQTTQLQVKADFILPSGDPISLAGLGIGTFSGTTIQSGLIARIYRDPPGQPTNHEIELIQWTNGTGQIIRKTPLGVFFTAGQTYSLTMQIGKDRHRVNSEILYVLLNGKVWLSFPVLPGVVRGDVILYANSLDTDTKITNFEVRNLT